MSCPLPAPASNLPETFQHSLSKQQALSYDEEEKASRAHKRCIVSKWVEGVGYFEEERVELIPSFRLIMPDVIPVVMLVTTKPIASLCP